MTSNLEGAQLMCGHKLVAPQIGNEAEVVKLRTPKSKAVGAEFTTTPPPPPHAPFRLAGGFGV